MINKLLKLLISIPYDKLFHSYMGYVISDIIFKFSSLPKLETISLIIIVLIIIGAGKELYDEIIQHENKEYKDILATVCGGIFNIIISAI